MKVKRTVAKIICVVMCIATLFVTVISVSAKGSLDSVARDIFETYYEDSEYSYFKTVDIGSNSFRLDASGYIDAVLTEYGVLDGQDYNSVEYKNDKSLDNTLSNNGFTKAFYSADAIKSSAILVRKGHCAIITRDGEDFTYYSFGSANSKIQRLTSDELDQKEFEVMYILR